VQIAGCRSGRATHDGIHDNTAANRRNPDPNLWVGFGERSIDDMLQVWLDSVYLDDAELQRCGQRAQGEDDGVRRGAAGATGRRSFDLANGAKAGIAQI
jgi:hypothetical protein